MTSSCGLRTGSVLISTLFTRLKIAVLAPIPSASDRTATGRESGIGGKDADGVTKVLSNHVTMLPEGGGDDVDERAGPDRELRRAGRHCVGRPAAAR